MTWNPFDWTAGPFLTLYLAMAAIVFVWSFSVKSAIGPATRATHQLSVLELAYLAGGARRLGDAILLCLTSGNGATVDPNSHKITVTDQTPLAPLMGEPPVLPVQPNMTRQRFQTAVEPIIERVQRRLQACGYCPTDQQMASFRRTVLPFVGLLLVIGMIKAFVGAGRNHPVGFLVALLVFTAVAGFALAKRPTRTQAGEDVLRTYEATHARASRAPLDHELLLALALSGAVVLSGTTYASVYAASKTMNGSDGGGGCGGDGGGGDGGGGCGGCGGGS